MTAAAAPQQDGRIWPMDIRAAAAAADKRAAAIRAHLRRGKQPG